MRTMAAGKTWQPKQMSTRRLTVIDPKTWHLDEQAAPWERQAGESILWFGRFTRYLLLGERRSIVRAWGAAEKPRGGLDDWRRYAAYNRWVQRAERYDEHLYEEELARRGEALHTGFALDYERVLYLKEQALKRARALSKLEDALAADADHTNVLLERRWDLMNKALTQTFADLAAETGGRAKRVNVVRELTDYAVQLARERGYDEQLAVQVAKLVAADLR